MEACPRENPPRRKQEKATKIIKCSNLYFGQDNIIGAVFKANPLQTLQKLCRMKFVVQIKGMEEINNAQLQNLSHVKVHILKKYHSIIKITNMVQIKVKHLIQV
jgi:hypothetical protein